MRRFLNRNFILLAALAVGIRLGLYFALPGVFAFERTGSVPGFFDYDLIAKNIVAAGQFTVELGVPYAGVAPGYPYALAAIYAIFGRYSLAVVLLNCVFAVVTIGMLLAISRRVMPRGEIVGAIAAFLFAVYPYFAFQDLTVIDTGMITALQFVFLYIAVMIVARPELDRRTRTLIALAGLLLGLIALTRPLSVAIGIAIFFWFWIKRGLRIAIVRLIPVAVIGVLVLIPWNIRNYRVFGRFVNIGTHAGANFWFGSSKYTIPFFRAGYHTQWVAPEPPPQPLTAPEMDSYLLNLGLKYMRENPGRIPELMWVKFVAYWGIDIFPSKNPVAGKVPIEIDDGGTIARVSESDPLNTYAEPLFDRIGRFVHTIYFGSLLILGLIGVVLTRKHWREVSLIWFVQIVMTIMYVLLSGPTTRYRVPTDPLLFLFSACAVLAIWPRVRSKLRRGTPVGAPRV